MWKLATPQIIVVDNVFSEPIHGYPYFHDLASDVIYVSGSHAFHASLIETIQNQYDPEFMRWNDAARFGEIRKGTIYDQDIELAGGLEPALMRYSATRLIYELQPVQTTRNDHGDGLAFLLFGGILYHSTTSCSHAELYPAIEIILGYEGLWAFYDYLKENLDGIGRISLQDKQYRLYNTGGKMLGSQFEQEMREMGFSKASDLNMRREGVLSWQFVYVPGDEEKGQTWNDTRWISIIADLEQKIVYYTDPNLFHESIFLGVEDLAGKGRHSYDISDLERWLPGAYEFNRPKVAWYGSQKKVTPDLTEAILEFFHDDREQWLSADLKISHEHNPWHILRKPFLWDEPSNTLHIGRHGTGYLYRNSYTLEKHVSSEVKQALTQMFKRSFKTEEFEGWQFVSWVDEAPKTKMFDWRIPILVDVDEQKVFVGALGETHPDLVWRMGDTENDLHGQSWAQQRNIELGADDWFAGWLAVGEFIGKHVALWNNNDESLTAFLEKWWLNQPQSRFSKTAEYPRNQAWEGYWEGQDNATWWTSWIYDIDRESLIIRNEVSVNHPDLLSKIQVEDWPKAAVYGIIAKDFDEGGDVRFNIVPYYSDDPEPEVAFVDKAEQVAKAIEAVERWIGQNHPEWEYTIHQAAEFKPLEPEEPFYNWQGHQYQFEPEHLGEGREGINAYDGVDLIGSITWTDEGDFLFLRSAYVDPSYRGEGIFKELINQMPQDKPVEGEWRRDSPLADFFERYNQQWTEH